MGDAVVAGTLMGFALKIHPEGGGILGLFLRRIPLGVFDYALLVGRLALCRVQVGPAEILFDMVQGVAHHLLDDLRRDAFFAGHIGGNEGQGEELVVGHGVVVSDVVRLLHQLAIDRSALLHDLSGVLLGQHPFHRPLEHLKIKKTDMSPVFWTLD